MLKIPFLTGTSLLSSDQALRSGTHTFNLSICTTLSEKVCVVWLQGPFRKSKTSSFKTKGNY